MVFIVIMMDWRFTIIGAVMIGIGVTISLVFMNIANIVEVKEFVQNRMVAQIGGIVAGLGVLLLLISFGLQRRRRFRI